MDIYKLHSDSKGLIKAIEPHLNEANVVKKILKIGGIAIGDM